MESAENTQSQLQCSHVRWKPLLIRTDSNRIAELPIFTFKDRTFPRIIDGPGFGGWELVGGKA